MSGIVNNDFKPEEGVLVSLKCRQKFSEFEKSYLEVREKEKRVLSIEEIKQLPYVSNDSPDRELWKTRRHNIRRFLAHLDKKGKPQLILDVGCGNGFFTNKMKEMGHRVTGIDVNLPELKQAAQAFGSNGISWIYADLMEDGWTEQRFDVITFCCSFQYFDDPGALLGRCRSLLAPGGEIHIIDSPFYSDEAKEAAKQRSLDYFQKLGSESMQKFYHHNTYQALKPFNYVFKYRPNKLRVRLFHDSPFPWLMLTE